MRRSLWSLSRQWWSRTGPLSQAVSQSTTSISRGSSQSSTGRIWTCLRFLRCLRCQDGRDKSWTMGVYALDSAFRVGNGNVFGVGKRIAGVRAFSTLRSSARSYSTGSSRTGSSRTGSSRTSSSSKARRPLRSVITRATLLGGGALVAAASGGGYLVSGDVKHYYEAAERSGRVLTVLMRNINDYKTTLKSPPESPEDASALLKACHKRCAERTLLVLEKNGSIFIKLGQHLSSMGYLLPLEWTETFIPLQDKCPVSSYESIEEMFLRDTGKPLLDTFETFDKLPIGSASLAQVHRATLKGTGERVAVKVQHPSLEEWVPLDMALTRFSFSTLKRWFPEYDLEWLSDEMSISLPQELDFTLEAKNAQRAAEYFSHQKNLPLVIPEVRLGQKRILVMEYISGHRLDDLKFLDDNRIDRDEVSAALAKIFNEMIFGEGAPLHCDPHGGNIAIRKNYIRRGAANFDLILYDHGLYRDIPTKLRRDYAKLWLGVINSDEQEMRKYAKEVANINDELFPLFASAITGRDYHTVTTSISSPRTQEEKESISSALGDGMLEDLVYLLGHVPRIILLILKTNDLTRSLDEGLQTRQGPVRSFLILARYCARTVFQEQMEIIREHGSRFRPDNVVRFVKAWTAYMKVRLRLTGYEWYLSVRRAVGLKPLALSV